MHHYRLLARSILGDVLQSKALRQIEIELHGRELPQTANRVHQLEIDLWTVERRLAWNRLVLDPERLQHLFQRLRGMSPLLLAAHKIFPVLRIPRRKLGLKLVESKMLQHVEPKLQASFDLVFNLLRRAEDVR